MPAILLSEGDYLLREFLGIDAERDFLTVRHRDGSAFTLWPADCA